MKTVLVTGYNGFIGSNLIKFLESKGYNILGISNKSTKSTHKHIHKNITKINPLDIKENISLIIHLAALTDVDYCQKNASECFNVNVNGTKKILDIAREKKSKILFVSSSHVFGNPKSNPIKESDLKNPVSIYGKSKLACELLCESYSLSYKLDISIVRLFSVYGLKLHGNDVISKITSKVFTNDNIELGNLFPKRDFIYIRDVSDAIEKILKKSRGFEIYNVGTGKSYSILEITKILQKIGNKKMIYKSIKSLTRKSDVPDTFADNSKIKKLGWKQRTDFFDGLKQTYDWCLNSDSKSRKK